VVREGPAIDSNVLVALFEPFDRNDDATGVTLGLYPASALAVAHGGTLGAEQEADQGVLWLRIPSHVQRPSATAAAQ
jgi:K+-sensing histidine kinase KdpD